MRRLLLIVIICSSISGYSSVQDTITHWPVFLNNIKLTTKFPYSEDIIPEVNLGLDSLDKLDSIKTYEGGCLACWGCQTYIGLYHGDKLIDYGTSKGSMRFTSVRIDKILEHHRKNNAERYEVKYCIGKPWESENVVTVAYIYLE